MPRVHRVEKARKPQPEHGIAKGDTYYWWKFRRGGKRVSKSPPRPSQLTQSEFMSTFLSLEEGLPTELQIGSNEDDVRSLAGTLEDIANELESLASEQEDKKQNMPDALQESDTGQLLEQRAERCNEIAQDLQGKAGEIEELCDDDDLSWEEAREQALAIIQDIDWSVE